MLNEIKAKGWFGEDQEIARFCLAHAIASGVEPGTVAGASTRWTVSLFDPSGEIRTVLETVFPGVDTPVRVMEHLIHAGLAQVADKIRGGATPKELLQAGTDS